jgi:hypothetical protein
MVSTVVKTFRATELILRVYVPKTEASVMRPTLGREPRERVPDMIS